MMNMMSPAQKAAATRAARKAGFASPASADNTAQARNANVTLDLVIREDYKSLVITFRFAEDGVPLSRAETPELERALLDLCVRSDLIDDELVGHSQTLFCGNVANAD